MKKLEAVIFDWAGTMVDHGSLAPVRALTKLFARYGIRLQDSEIRRDMGISKKNLQRILRMPQVSIGWDKETGKRPDEQDAERLFKEFGPLQMEILGEYSRLISGAAETAERLRSKGLNVGSTTGYTRSMLDLLVAQSAARGYRPDVSLCPDDAGGGRLSVDVPANRNQASGGTISCLRSACHPQGHDPEKDAWQQQVRTPVQIVEG